MPEKFPKKIKEMNGNMKVTLDQTQMTSKSIPDCYYRIAREAFIDVVNIQINSTPVKIKGANIHPRRGLVYFHEWNVWIDDGLLNIGCHTFNKANTKKILDWIGRMR